MMVKFIARSPGGHAAMPPKSTPLARLGKMMAWIEENDPFPSVISDTTAQMLRCFGPYMRKFGFILKRPKLFVPLLKKTLPRLSPTAGALLKTTLVFTVSGGSKAANVIPTEAWVIGNLRCAPHQTQQEYAEASVDGKLVQLNCGHYVHDFEYEKIAEEIRDLARCL